MLNDIIRVRLLPRYDITIPENILPRPAAIASIPIVIYKLVGKYFA